jgi:hypothetical protein
MSNNIIDTANEYKKMAGMLEETAKEANYDGIDSNFANDALMRLFYVKSLEQKLDKLQEQLTEETDMQTFDAVYSTIDSVQSVSDMVFDQLEGYASREQKFEITIEGTSVDLESRNKNDLLNQLYKCEGIIRMAQKTASRYPLYGNSSAGWEHLGGIDTEAELTEEDRIYDELGINIYELLDIRKKLVSSLESIIKKEN